jgi:transcription elongation factor Elf1
MPNAQLFDKPLSREPNCPMCQARMKVLRTVAGRPGFEHWTLRCENCGLVHVAQGAANPVNSEARGGSGSEPKPLL